MRDASNACRQGRGDPRFSGVTIVDVLLDDGPGSEVIAADSDDFLVVDALWFEIPDDVVAIDLDVNIDDYFNAARTIATVHETGSLIDLRALWTWENPNPPANKYQGIITLTNVALDPDATDNITILGNDSTDANNYDSTAGVSMQVVARARLIKADAFE